MTNHRKVYLRKKEGGYIFEGKMHGKTVYIWTIPKDYDNFLKDLCKSSFFGKDKSSKIMEILCRLDYAVPNDNNNSQEVRTIKVRGTLKKDEDEEELDDLDEELTELKDRF